MQISKRLEAVAAMVTPGSILADIGTDHAYIPIYLVSRGRIPRALAMDVNRGPLARAAAHIASYGLEQSIETRLSDGLCMLKKNEAQSVLIAGMGGPLTVRILQDGCDALEGCAELILQPQSEIRLVRAYLEKSGWQIAAEDMLCEEGKFYQMMRAVRGSGRAMTPQELRFGPLLLRQRHPVLQSYLARERRLQEEVLQALQGRGSEAASVRRREVEEELRIIREAEVQLAKKPPQNEESKESNG